MIRVIARVAEPRPDVDNRCHYNWVQTTAETRHAGDASLSPQKRANGQQLQRGVSWHEVKCAVLHVTRFWMVLKCEEDSC